MKRDTCIQFTKPLANGYPTAQIWTWWTTDNGKKCSSGSANYDVDELKQRLIDVWHCFEQSVIDDAVDEGRNRIGACIRAKRKFWAFNIAPYNAYVVLCMLFVNSVNTKQVLLCYMQQNIPNFSLLYFADLWCGAKYRVAQKCHSFCMP